MKIFKAFILLLLVLPLHAQDFDQLNKEADAEYQAKNYKKAIKLYDQIIELDPTYVWAYLDKAYAHWYSESYDEAIKTLEEGIAKNPKTAMFNDTRGLFFNALGNPQAALREYSIALDKAEKFETDTVYYTVLMNRASVYRAIREYDLAYADLTSCYEFDSTNLKVLNNLAINCDEVGKGEQTLGFLLRVIEVDSLFVPGYVNIGFHYQTVGKYEASLSYFDKAIELMPGEPLSLNNRGYSKLKTGDYKGALADIDQSIEIYPGNSYAYRNRALVYLEMGKTKKACEDIEKALTQGFTEMYGTEMFNLQQEHCE